MADNSQKDLAVIIVSWNVKDLLLANLASVFASKIPNHSFEVILVDNASHDGTIEAVRSAFPQVQLIANQHNLGFAKACNQGIEASHARHALLLNPDMRIEPDALALTIDYLDAHPEVAVMGAKLFNSHGKPMHHMRRFPTLLNQLAIIFKVHHLFPRLLDRYHGKDLSLEHEQFVDSVRGSYFAINETALERLGMLDEKYFLWYEEVDYCRRAKHFGMKVAYVPSVVAHDAVGRSFAQHELKWKQEQVSKSMVVYFAHWHSGWELLLVKGAWALIRPFMYLL